MEPSEKKTNWQHFKEAVSSGVRDSTKDYFEPLRKHPYLVVGIATIISIVCHQLGFDINAYLDHLLWK